MQAAKGKRLRRFNYMVQEGKGGYLARGTFGPVFKCLNTDTCVGPVMGAGQASRGGEWGVAFA